MLVIITIKKLNDNGSVISLYDIGYEFGKNILNIKNISDLKKFFKKNNLGNLKIVKKRPLIIKVEDCAFCDGLDMDSRICYFDAGLLAGVLENIYNKKFVVDEIDCMAKGADACYFKVEEIKEL